MRFRISLGLTESKNIGIDRFYTASSAEEAEELAVRDVHWDLQEGSIPFETWSTNTNTEHNIIVNDIIMVEHDYTPYTTDSTLSSDSYTPYWPGEQVIGLSDNYTPYSYTINNYTSNTL